MKMCLTQAFLPGSVNPADFVRFHCAGIIVIMFLLSSCTVNPVTLKREFNVVSEEREIRLGRNASPAVAQQFGGVYDDKDLQKYIDEVGQRLVDPDDGI